MTLLRRFPLSNWLTACSVFWLSSRSRFLHPKPPSSPASPPFGPFLFFLPIVLSKRSAISVIVPTTDGGAPRGTRGTRGAFFFPFFLRP